MHQQSGTNKHMHQQSGTNKETGIKQLSHLVVGVEEAKTASGVELLHGINETVATERGVLRDLDPDVGSRIEAVHLNDASGVDSLIPDPD